MLCYSILQRGHKFSPLLFKQVFEKPENEIIYLLSEDLYPISVSLYSKFIKITTKIQQGFSPILTHSIFLGLTDVLLIVKLNIIQKIYCKRKL